MRCQFNSPGAGVYSSRTPGKFEFPRWLEIDETWFQHEVERLMLEFLPGLYQVNVVYSTYARSYFADRAWGVTVGHQAFAVDFHSAYCLSPGHGVIVGTVVVPAVPVEDLSHGTKER